MLKINKWGYLQHFVTTLPQPIRDGGKLNPIEQLCSVQTPVKHGISQIYGIITDLGGWRYPHSLENENGNWVHNWKNNKWEK